VSDLPDEVDPVVARFPHPEDIRSDALTDPEQPSPDWHLRMREAATPEDHISSFNNFI
jgi:hypothetical protein